ncbi:MAG TPA: DUF6152 family protein [Gammaproteobacteria bacterium]|nr:DUF6152 family protein [Gammaproteobacteria bacterium]
MAFMKRTLPIVGAAAALFAAAASAHHAIGAKFDDTKPGTLNGIVTLVDWRNPHVHVFLNAKGPDGAVQNWAVELASAVELERSGWRPDSVKPGDALAVDGIFARDGTRQLWGESVKIAASGRKILYTADLKPVAPDARRPAPRWPDGVPILGANDSTDGYWGFPTATSLVQQGASVAVDANGVLANIADAKKVAPFQPWALALYENRQRRHLQDDPLFTDCRPPGGPRQFQSALGVQFVEDRERQRIFVLMGSGDRNYRIIYLDGRQQVGQVGGDDDNPLFYGRSVGKWEGDTLVVDTIGFNEAFWFSNGGLPHTSLLHLTERFSRPDFDTLHYEVTIDDPGAYTKPWTSSWDLRWVGGEELPTFFCQDNRP